MKSALASKERVHAKFESQKADILRKVQMGNKRFKGKKTHARQVKYPPQTKSTEFLLSLS